MLLAASRAVKPGGVLVYSVCTFTEEEGPEAVADFLAAAPDFEVAPPPACAVDWSALAKGSGYRTWPHRHDMDAFFAARLRRRG